MRLRTSLKYVAKMNLKGAKVAELHVDELANKNPKVARLHVYQPVRGGGPHDSESRLSLECRFLSREVLVCFLAQGHCVVMAIVCWVV